MIGEVKSNANVSPITYAPAGAGKRVFVGKAAPGDHVAGGRNGF